MSSIVSRSSLAGSLARHLAGVCVLATCDPRCGGAPPATRRCSRGARSIWRDPGPAESLDLAAGPGGRDGAPAPPVSVHRRTCLGQQSLRLRARRARPRSGGSNGATKSTPRRSRRGSRGPPDISSRSTTSFPAGASTAPRRCSARAHASTNGDVQRRALRARRAGRREAFRRAQLGVERQSVRRHAAS